jgi:hypothetical protein
MMHGVLQQTIWGTSVLTPIGEDGSRVSRLDLMHGVLQQTIWGTSVLTPIGEDGSRVSRLDLTTM